jgi:hypothetical protein
VNPQTHWKITPAEQWEDNAITDGELIGIAVALNSLAVGEDVYRRAWRKIQWAVAEAIDGAGR